MKSAAIGVTFRRRVVYPVSTLPHSCASCRVLFCCGPPDSRLKSEVADQLVAKQQHILQLVGGPGVGLWLLPLLLRVQLSSLRVCGLGAAVHMP